MPRYSTIHQCTRCRGPRCIFDSDLREMRCEACDHSWIYRGSKVIRPVGRRRSVHRPMDITLPETERAWIAGVVDAKASIYVIAGIRPMPNVVITSRHKPLLSHLTGMFPAAISSGWKKDSCRTPHHQVQYTGFAAFLELFAIINPYITQTTRDKFNAVIKQYQDATAE